MVALAKTRPARAFDPDSYRMTIGEHLEELRRRLAWALLGFGIALVVCLLLGRRLLTDVFCAPLLRELSGRGYSTEIYYREMGEVFMVYLKISLISALILAAPWLLYQLWLFVAAGMYEHERRHLTRYLPMSVALTIGGVLFVYFLVLPWTVGFFLDFARDVQMPVGQTGAVERPALVDLERPTVMTPIAGDPERPVDGQIWFNTIERRLKLFSGGQTFELAMTPRGGALTPQITISDYVDTVLGMLVVFAICFQLPLAVMALASVGVFDVAALRAGRRYVYFALVIVSAVVTPGDFLGTTLALFIPLVLLYELGILLAQLGRAPTNVSGRVEQLW